MKIIEVSGMGPGPLCAMLLALGMVSALLETRKSGEGKVVDAAMTDGSALLMALFYSLNAQGQWTTERGCNLLDGGAPFYAVYETGDGKYVSIGAIEPQFYAFLMDKLGLDGEEGPTREDPRNWPVLDFQEAPHHPHNRARSTYIEVNGLTQPAPAPRFSRTPSAVKFPPREPGSDMQTLLDDWGVASEGAQL